jgi:hypothetical protein
MLDLESGKRVTWFLSPDVHSKLTRIAKSANLSLQEVGNLILQNVDMDTLKPIMSRYIKEKRENEKRKKKAAETVSNLDPATLEKLSSYTPEQIEKMLSAGQ